MADGRSEVSDQHSFREPIPPGLRGLTDESGQPLEKNIYAHTDPPGDGFDCSWANFATGVGHVYLNGEADPPACCFSWQRI
jgi:hypothetical protein